MMEANEVVTGQPAEPMVMVVLTPEQYQLARQLLDESRPPMLASDVATGIRRAFLNVQQVRTGPIPEPIPDGEPEPPEQEE